MAKRCVIDASHCYTARRKSIGTKRNDISDSDRELIVKAYVTVPIATDTKEKIFLWQKLL